MMKMTLLTASWNSAATIGDTLRSVAAQTYPQIEHIIIDGGSKDDTMAIVARDGVHVARAVSEQDKGIYDAYNKGIAMASHEIIGFINSDDFYCSDGVVAEVMAAFEADPALEAVHGDLVYVKQDDTTKIVRHWKSRDCTEKSLSRGFIPAHPTVFLRRSVYEKAGSFDLDYRLAADYEFLLRIFHTHKIKARYIPHIWVRMRAGGATGGNVSSIKLQNDEIRRAQAKHGVHYPSSKFYVWKVIDRTMQRLRARFVQMPPEVTAA
jgi:glycosyltransferase involved in cell wall biosynthesis